ncbi:MAG: membrane dipeptidase [Roseibium sp.]|uniref:dipeptidase n=1 Tax=Roseibium sp. TaxID=1936156 RepID=UPI003D9C0F97
MEHYSLNPTTEKGASLSEDERNGAPLDLTAISEESLARAKKVIAETPVIDLHNHLGVFETRGISAEKIGMSLSVYSGDEVMGKNIENMIKGGNKCAYINFTGDFPLIDFSKPGNKSRDWAPGEAWEYYQHMWKQLHELIDMFPLEIATSSNDINRIFDSGKLALLLSTEGGHMLEDDPSRLDTLYEDGVRKFCLFHYVGNALGDNGQDEPHYGGLTPLGRDAVLQASKLNMVIDCAHCGFESAYQVANLTGNPIVFSHGFMKYESKKFGSYLYDYPRYYSKEFAQLIAQTGGVLGTWAVSPYAGNVHSAEAFVDAVNKLADTVGIDHVGWGTDYITGGMPNWFPDFTYLPYLSAMLLDSGFCEEDLAKFLGLNSLRVHQQVTGQ